MSGARFTPELEARWRDDGWCVFAGAIPPEDLAAAQHALRELFPTAAEMDAAPPDDPRTAPWRTWDAAWPEFPFARAALNNIVVNDVVIDLAQRLLQTPDVHCYLALASAKYFNQSSGYNQLFHADYPNHSLLVPRRDAYQHLETFIYLSDVGPANGATRFVSYRETAHVPVEEHTLNLRDYADLYAEAGDASAPAGTIVAYRPDVYHRSVDFTEPGASRFMLHVAYKPAGTEWGGYQSWPFKGFSPEWHNFVRAASPRQLMAIGFPKPGHPYWTDETLAGVAARYPGVDLAPWRVASPK